MLSQFALEDDGYMVVRNAVSAHSSDSLHDSPHSNREAANATLDTLGTWIGIIEDDISCHSWLDLDYEEIVFVTKFPSEGPPHLSPVSLPPFNPAAVEGLIATSPADVELWHATWRNQPGTDCY